MSIHSYSISENFCGIPPDIRELKESIKCDMDIELTEILFSGDVVEFHFNENLCDAGIKALDELVKSAKYSVDFYSTYDGTDVYASLWQGAKKIKCSAANKVSLPILSVNSSCRIDTDMFLKAFGVEEEEINSQIVINRKGVLCDFVTVVSGCGCGLNKGTRIITVRVNEEDTELSISYDSEESGSKTNPNKFSVDVGDLISIKHTVDGEISASNVIATISIL